jgi:hypothetical protein
MCDYAFAVEEFRPNLNGARNELVIAALLF